MEKPKIIFFATIGLFALSILHTSCKEDISQSVSINNNVWQINDTILLNAEISELNSYYNIFFNIAAEETFLTENLWLYVSTVSPSGNVANDTLQYFIFDKIGKPYGKKSGELIKNKFAYKSRIRFPEKGIYRFKICHGMRESDLPKIKTFGIDIAKTE